MAPPAHSSSSHSPVSRKRRSSSSSDGSDRDKKYLKIKHRKKEIESHHESSRDRKSDVRHESNYDKRDSMKNQSSRDRRSESVSSSRNMEGRWKHDKWKESDDDKFVKPMDRNRKEDFRRDRRSQSRSNFHRERNHNSVMEDFMDHRRLERERITLVGVDQVWGKSPSHAEE
jgi:hypothetical protein